MNPKRLRLDFGVYHIRVMRVNEAPPLFLIISHAGRPGKGLRFSG